MQDNRREKRFFLTVLIQGIVIFLILFSFFIYELSMRAVSLEILFHGTIKSLSIAFATSTAVITSRFLYFRISHSKKQRQEKHLADYLLDIYIGLLFIITTTQLRPVLQEIRPGATEKIEYALVRFDGLQSLIILSIIAVPLILMLVLKTAGAKRYLTIAAVLATLPIVAIVNERPNYDARTAETRAEWVMRDWDGQSESAAKALKNATTPHEKAVAYYWLGVAENRKGNPQKAADYQMKAIEEDPGYGPPYSSLSMAHMSMGLIEDAWDSAQKCRERSPDYAWCYYAIGIYFDYKNDKKNAYINFKKATVLDPENEDLRNTYQSFLKLNPSFQP